MKHYLLFAAGKDRPGIVAAISRILYRHGCNMADSTMTRIASEFAMLLIFQAPAGWRVERIGRELQRCEKRLGLFTGIKPLAPSESRTLKPKGRAHIISVYGADRPGIVYRVSRCLASKRINITHVSTHRTETSRAAGYVMLLEVELPSLRMAAGLNKSLGRLAAGLGLHVSMRPVEIAKL